MKRREGGEPPINTEQKKEIEKAEFEQKTQQGLRGGRRNEDGGRIGIIFKIEIIATQRTFTRCTMHRLVQKILDICRSSWLFMHRTTS